MKYLRRLWSQFYGEPPHNDAAEAMRVELSPTISAEQRKKLLQRPTDYSFRACEGVFSQQRTRCANDNETTCIFGIVDMPHMFGRVCV